MGRAFRSAGVIGVGFAVVVALAWAARGLAQPGAERALVLAVNPERAQALLDAIVVLVTDFSLPTFAVVFTAWFAASELARREIASPAAIERGMLVLGAATGLGVVVALGDHYAAAGIPEAMVPVAMAGFWGAGRSLRRPTSPAVARARRAYGASLLAIALALAAEPLLEALCVMRHRPLADEHAAWNGALRALADEHVTSGSSYVSGHALSFFALVTPLALTLRSRAARAGLAGWAAFHSWTRLYVAAHFPLGVLVGSAAGVALGALAAWAGPVLRSRGGAPPRAPTSGGAYPALPEAP